MVELAGCRIERKRNVGTRFVAGDVDRGEDKIQSLRRILERRRVTAFVADERREMPVVQQFAERVKDFGAAAHGIAFGGRSERNDHDLLELQRALGVFPAVDHVHHRHGQRRRARAAQIAKERQRQARRRRARDGERRAQHRIRAERTLIRRTVELDEFRIDLSLRGRIQPFERGTEHVVNGGDGFEHAFAAVAMLVTVA